MKPHLAILGKEVSHWGSSPCSGHEELSLQKFKAEMFSIRRNVLTYLKYNLTKSRGGKETLRACTPSYCTERYRSRNSCRVGGNQPATESTLSSYSGKTISRDRNMKKVIMKSLLPFSCTNSFILELSQGKENTESPPALPRSKLHR